MPFVYVLIVYFQFVFKKIVVVEEVVVAVKKEVRLVHRTITTALKCTKYTNGHSCHLDSFLGQSCT